MVADGCECDEAAPCIIGARLNPPHKVLHNLVDSSTMDSMDVVDDVGVVGVLESPRENQGTPAANTNGTQTTVSCAFASLSATILSS